MSDDLIAVRTDPAAADYLRAVPDRSAVEAVAEVRRRADPLFMPSGISGFSLRARDHIALFVLPGAADDSHLPVLFRYVAAGANNEDRHEAVVLELSDGATPAMAEAGLAGMIAAPRRARIDVVDWDRNSGDYRLGHFDLAGMWQAITNQRPRMEGVDQPAFRCASEDCSFFVRWLDNAGDYPRYEAQLPEDLSRLLPGPFLQLCTFKDRLLVELADAQDIPAAESVATILASHNRVIAVADDRILFDGAARERLMDQYGISRSRYRAQVLRSRASALRARFLPRGYSAN